MRLFFAIAMVAIAAMMGGCGGGSSSPAPTGFKVAAGDTSATVSWDTEPGVEYWVWVIPGTSIDTQNCSAACRIFVNVPSPFIVAGLTNGITYSITVNGRTNGGRGGRQAPR